MGFPHVGKPSQPQQPSTRPEPRRTASSSSSEFRDPPMNPPQALSDASLSTTADDYDESKFVRSMIVSIKRLTNSYEKKFDKLKISEKGLKDQLEDKRREIEALSVHVKLHEDNCRKQYRLIQNQAAEIRKLRNEREQKVEEMRKEFETSLEAASQQHQSQLKEMEVKHNEELQKLRDEMNKTFNVTVTEKDKANLVPAPGVSTSNASELPRNGNHHESPLSSSSSPPHLVPYYEEDSNENAMDITGEPDGEAESVEQPQQWKSSRARKTPSHHSLNVSKVRKSRKLLQMTKSVHSVRNMRGKFANEIVSGTGNNAIQRKQKSRNPNLKGKGKFKCPKCENVKLYLYLSRMKTHMKLNHGIPDAFENMVGCSFCGEMFESKSLLQRHHVDAHKRMYDRNFGLKPSVEHGVGATSTDPMESTDVPTPCTSRGLLNMANGALLKKVQHSVDPGFPNRNVCACGETLKHWRGLKRHMRIYNLGKIFRCHYCKKLFLEFRGLKGHFQNRHKNFQCEMLRFECALCPGENQSLFESRQSLEEHCLQAHDLQLI